MPATTNPFKVIASLEAEACSIAWNGKRKEKIDEMMRYTEAIIGEAVGRPAPLTHEGNFEYNRRGELIGFYLSPIVKEFIKQL